MSSYVMLKNAFSVFSEAIYSHFVSYFENTSLKSCYRCSVYGLIIPYPLYFCISLISTRLQGIESLKTCDPCPIKQIILTLSSLYSLTTECVYRVKIFAFIIFLMTLKQEILCFTTNPVAKTFSYLSVSYNYVSLFFVNFFYISQ